MEESIGLMQKFPPNFFVYFFKVLFKQKIINQQHIPYLLSKSIIPSSKKFLNKDWKKFRGPIFHGLDRQSVSRASDFEASGTNDNLMLTSVMGTVDVPKLANSDLSASAEWPLKHEI